MWEMKQKNKKVDAVKELYEEFSEEKLKGNSKIPEYQKLFSRLFKDVLVTTNYDKALESCYSSILSYSYMDLNSAEGSGSLGEFSMGRRPGTIVSNHCHHPALQTTVRVQIPETLFP